MQTKEKSLQNLPNKNTFKKKFRPPDFDWLVPMVDAIFESACPLIWILTTIKFGQTLRDVVDLLFQICKS